MGAAPKPVDPTGRLLEQAFPGRRADREHHKGMSLRDYFAGQAIVGMIFESSTNEGLAEAAYKLADAMLKERTR